VEKRGKGGGKVRRHSFLNETKKKKTFKGEKKGPKHGGGKKKKKGGALFCSTSLTLKDRRRGHAIPPILEGLEKKRRNYESYSHTPLVVQCKEGGGFQIS